MRNNRGIIKLISVVLCILMILTTIQWETLKVQGQENDVALNGDDFIKANGKVLRNQNGTGDVVTLEGTNAGAWLIQELWMTYTKETSNVKAESDIYRVLEERFGESKMHTLIDTYQDAFWTETDFQNCQEMGMNCIRLPFWYRNLVDENGDFYGYDENASDPYEKAFEKIDWFIETAGKYGIYVILDCHGAPGSQSGEHHSGVDGGDNDEEASQLFFGEEAKDNQEEFYNIWEVIANRYKDNPAVAGYDLLNEAFSSYRYSSSVGATKLHELLWNVYDTAYDRIRLVDPNHVIIMEAVYETWDLPNPSTYGWENVMYEYHQYCWNDLDNTDGQQVSTMKSKINSINSANYNVPSYIGEFSFMNNMDAWDEGLNLLMESGFSWTMHSYKTISYDNNWGIYHFNGVIGQINIETAPYYLISWAWKQAGKAKPNQGLIDVLTKYYKQNGVKEPEENIPDVENPSTPDVEKPSTPDAENPSTPDVENPLTPEEGKEPQVIRLETEDAKLYGDTVHVYQNEKYSNGSAVNHLNSEKWVSAIAKDWSNINYAEYTFDVEKAGNYKVVCYYTGYAKDAMQALYQVNNTGNQKFWYNNGGNSTDQVNSTSFVVKLNAGCNTLKMTGTLARWSYWVDVDCIEISSIEDKELGTYEMRKYEGEGASYCGTRISLPAAENYSNGLALKMFDPIKTDAVESDWSNISYGTFDINVLTAGTYTVTMYYDGYAADDMSSIYRVNGGINQILTYSDASAASGNVRTKIFTIQLNQGLNQLDMSGILGSWSKWIAIDYIQIDKM